MKEKFDYSNFLDISQTIAKDIFQDITYVWEAIPKIKDFILNIGKTLPKDEYTMVSENVWISKYANISSTAHIEGPTIIQKNAQIRHCAFIRGSAIIGENSVVGNSTELKNCILFNNVQVPHFNYIGDSILGYKSHFGAGAITSNVKSDKSNISVNIDNSKIDTGLRKFGAIVGDFVEIGCNTVLNPGTIIGKNSTIYPLSMLRGVIDENMIFKNNNDIIKKRIAE